MNIYLVRHAESEGNAKGYVSSPKTRLTMKGHVQAKKLGRRLLKERIKIDNAYCSEFRRSIETIDDIFTASRLGDTPVEITNLLNEISRKEFEGKKKSDYYLKKEQSKLLDDYRCRGGESENDVKKRAAKFLDVLRKERASNVLMVTHGHFIKHFMEILHLAAPEKIHGASLSKIVLGDKTAKLEFFNDTKHLENQPIL